MVLTPHSVVGAVIANLMPENPEFGFALAWASHYVLDTIPHYDYNIDNFYNKDENTVNSIFQNTKARLNFLTIGLDFFVGLVICFLLFVRHRQSLILTAVGILGGILPDILQFIYLKFKNQPWIFFQKIHDFFHNPDKMKDRQVKGVLIQIFVVIVFIITFFFGKIAKQEQIINLCIKKNWKII